ncbi:hypothetical protein [Xenorhabdus bovienii]|uniref:Uncharacterized protein n=1 Tax=Xenorhabdus bovienii str. kraussei Becker Underwood TaxID=1398204 RepID=A0A077Q386_XENBV|nr:hypothetical protein [Xenorhabdus bovienii]CDG87110.1 hypothetical protein XBFFR1_1520002 [Xenorhabdus bovienii str. feltiae France]CDG91149.1 hypothetical protein XBFFL1_1330002 [Xenorhabdus bovienii str. feltiae Florida]CDH26514.1 hypothetical protein XBKB1_750007 [Xenorhabdus bovienii str. kraussei Becker Underwood]
MFNNITTKEDYTDLHTVLEAVMILENMKSSRANDIAKQIIELLSAKAKEASSINTHN